MEKACNKCLAEKPGRLYVYIQQSGVLVTFLNGSNKGKVIRWGQLKSGINELLSGLLSSTSDETGSATDDETDNDDEVFGPHGPRGKPTAMMIHYSQKTPSTLISCLLQTNTDSEPRSLKEALSRSDADNWMSAVQEEY